MEVSNTVTDMFTDDLREDFETDLMFRVINQVGDQIDQTAGLGDSLTDNIIKGEVKRSSVKENHGLFTEKNTIESIALIESTLDQMKGNFDLLIMEGVQEGNFYKLKEYTTQIGKLDKDVYYAQYNNQCLEEAIKQMEEVKEAFIATENAEFSRSLPNIQQHVIASKINTGLSLSMVESCIDLMETKLQKRVVATEQLLSEISDDQFAYEVEETNNEEPTDESIKKDPKEEENPFDDMEGTMEEAALDLIEINEGLVSLDDSMIIQEGLMRQAIKSIQTLIAAPMKYARNGDYSKLRVALLKRVKNAKKMEDIDYLLNDVKNSKPELTKLAKNIEKAQAAKDPDADQKAILKRVKKGLTAEKVREHIKWLQDVYVPNLKAKKNELKKQGKK